MHQQQKAYLNWSGGKDSALALHHALRDDRFQVAALFTTLSAGHDRVTMHGVRRALLEQQAAAIGLPLHTAHLPEQPSMELYEQTIGASVQELKKNGMGTALFGDIFLEDLKQYREQQLAPLGLACHFPLWGRKPHGLMQEFLALGFQAIVVCVNGALLDRSFCGRLLDASFLADLPPGVDPCGENGEYHSFVFDGPLFGTPVPFNRGSVVARSYPAPKEGDNCFAGQGAPDYTFYFCDLEPVH